MVTPSVMALGEASDRVYVADFKGFLPLRLVKLFAYSRYMRRGMEIQMHLAKTKLVSRQFAFLFYLIVYCNDGSQYAVSLVNGQFHRFGGLFKREAVSGKTGNVCLACGDYLDRFF